MASGIEIKDRILERLNPPKNVCIVWMQTASGEMKNIGQLNFNWIYVKDIEKFA